MALTNTTSGEYFKIIYPPDLISGKINYYIFKDVAQRNAYETGLSPFENFLNDTLLFPNLSEQIKSIPVGTQAFDGIMSLCYERLKIDMPNLVDC